MTPTESHPALSEEHIKRLRTLVDQSQEEPPPSVPAPEPSWRRISLKELVKRYIRRAIAWYVDPATQQAASGVEERVSHRLTEFNRRLEAIDDINALTINQELMKGEFRALQGTLQELGTAIAPAAGLDGAAARLAELRERLNALERRTRPTTPGQPSPKVIDGVHTDARRPAPSTAEFDYVGFERRFRGDSETILATQKDRYLELLQDHGPVLDLGCGRGELLAALAELNIECSGVELDPSMVSEARARGLQVKEGDAVEFLRSTSEHSFGSITAMHVAEHLEFASLVELLELAVTRLEPGGLFIAETPNPASLIVLGNSYVLDPTHVRPLHPSLMVFLCESAGFRDVRLRFYSPASDYHLPMVDYQEAPAWADQVNSAFEKLNQVLFGPQEYAVLATTPPEHNSQ